LIWNLNKKNKIEKINVDVVNNEGLFIKTKSFYSFTKNEFISNWLRKHYDSKNETLGYLILPGVDMQAQNGVYITTYPTPSDIIQHKNTKITINNLIQISIYLSVRHCIEATWLNDRDQFLFPNDGWQTDTEFQNDCLAYALFHGQNKISSNSPPSEGCPAGGVVNHWIPFIEQEVNAREKFASHFMTDFIKGKIKPEDEKEDLFVVNQPKVHYAVPLKFSEEAKAVFEGGREIWKHYHSQNFSSNFHSLSGQGELGLSEGRGGYNVNASFYDIRAYFQGRNDKGRMNPRSTDEQYTTLIANLREAINVLAKKIEPKVYEYGFLKE